MSQSFLIRNTPLQILQLPDRHRRFIRIAHGDEARMAAVGLQVQSDGEHEAFRRIIAQRFAAERIEGQGGEVARDQIG